MARKRFISIDARQVQTMFAAYPVAAKRRMDVAFDDMGRIFVNAVRSRFGTGSDAPHTRTGTLVRSIGYRGPKQLGITALVAYSAGTSYARMQEYGKRGHRARPPKRYLTIPVADGLTKAGVARYPSASYLMQQYGPRAKRGKNDARAWIMKSKRGNLVLMLKLPGQRKAKLIYVLKRKVTIPPRLRFNRTWSEQRDKRQLIIIGALKQIADDVNKAVKRSTGDLK